MRITRLLAAECRLPLPRPLRLGPIEMTSRDYVALRIETESGLAGDALGYPRGSALLETLARLAPALAGADALMRRALLTGLDRRLVTGRLALLRAMSLLDIALWDIAAKAARMPLHLLLGGWRRRVPVTAVAGYHAGERDAASIREEVMALFDAGHPRVKVMLRGDDDAADLRLVEMLAPLAGHGRLAADLHWSFHNITDAARLCARLDGFGLSFIEDPFAATEPALTRALQARLATPVAAGEDAAGAVALAELAQGIGLLRVDATTCGGITAALAATQAAGLAGRPVLPHVFAPLHAELAGALPEIEGVEWIPPAAGTEPMDAILARPVAPREGWLHLSEDAGAGLALDWEAVARHAAGRVLEIRA